MFYACEKAKEAKQSTNTHLKGFQNQLTNSKTQEPYTTKQKLNRRNLHQNSNAQIITIVKHILDNKTYKPYPQDA